MKAKLITLFVGVFIAVASWVPLWIIAARDISSIGSSSSVRSKMISGRFTVVGGSRLQARWLTVALSKQYEFDTKHKPLKVLTDRGQHVDEERRTV